MLVLGSPDSGFRDDADPQRRYRLPTGLRPRTGPDGVPQASLSRRTDGRGLLQLQLGAVWPDLGPHERAVPLASGRFRLQWRTPTSATAGAWHEAALDGDALVSSVVSLGAAEAAIARLLLPGGSEVVEVELELEVPGRHPTFPWRAHASAATLRDRVLALLGEGATEWSDVEDAFTGLPMDAFEWIPLEPGALPPPPDQALRALARHAAPVLLVRGEPGWSAAPSVPDRLELSLAVARAGTHRFALRWSFSDFLAAQPDPTAHLRTLDDPAPFEAAEVQLVNDVLLHEHAVRSIAVDLVTGGPSGRLQHVFRAGEPSAVRLPFVREGYEPLALKWRPTTIVEHGGRPTSMQGRFVPGDITIRITTQHLGVTPLRMRAEAVVFEHAEAIEVVLSQRTLRLTAAAPEAWVLAGPRPPASVSVRAVLDDGTTASLGELPLGPQGLLVGAAELGVGDAAEVVLTAPADLDTRAAYLAVQVQDGPWRTLEEGGELRWAVRRPTRLHAPRTRYRTRHVPRGPDGSTEPITESQWREAVGETATVEV